MKNLQLVSLLVLLVFVACQKDTIPETNSTSILENYQPKVENVSASVIGIVVDENDDPINEAQVKLGSQTFTTDEYGHFFLNDVTINSRGAVVNIKKSGFFDGSRRFFPKENAENRIKIKLLEQSFDQSFTSDDGGKITLTNGAAIDFDANSIETINGTAYTGTVEIAAKWMNPTDPSTMDQMPGNLQGVNQESQEVALATYGMIAVELQDENGASLNIAKNATAQLTMPVPESMLANAPTEIPLWSYNEEVGIWVEESVATLQNGAYVGEVSHFSFWNCDAPFPLVEFDLKLIDRAGLGVSNTLVSIEVLDMQAVTGSGYTDENGILSGLLPSNESLLLRVLNTCGEELYTETVGPFSSNIDLGEIPIFTLAENITTISGSLECNGVSSTNGLVIVRFGEQKVYHHTSSGSFSFSFTTCESTTSVGVIVIDLDDGMQSTEVNVMAGNSTDLGVIQACDAAVENYLRINISGEEAFYFDIISGEGITWTSIEVELGSTAGYINIAFYGKFIGDHSGPGQNSINQIVDVARSWFVDETEMDVFDISAYGEIGEPVRGSFSGTLDNGESIEGDFSFIRQ